MWYNPAGVSANKAHHDEYSTAEGIATPLFLKTCNRRRSQVVKAGVCKTLIGGSNPPGASSENLARILIPT
jgi:hypothetical protein